MGKQINQENISAALAKGNKRAFREIFRLYYPRLERYAVYFLKNHEQAEDLVQDVFLQIWKNRKTLNTFMIMKKIECITTPTIH